MVWGLALFGLCLKAVLAARFPFVSDEAYYLSWGLAPALGYYDHPPMVGWISSFSLLFGSHPLWLRLPELLLTFGIGVWMLRAGHTLAAFLYFVSPTYFLGIAAIPNSYLCLFAFLSVHWASQRRWILAGLAFSLGVCSNYLIALFVPALVFALWQERSWKSLSRFVLGAAPFLVVHLGWNAAHCMINILYTAGTRHAGLLGINPIYQVQFWGYLCFLLGPAFCAGLLVNLKHARHSTAMTMGVLSLGFFGPLVLLALSALFSGQGLHWMQPAAPFAFLWLAPRLKTSIPLVRAFGWLSAAAMASLFVFAQLQIPKLGPLLSERLQVKHQADWAFYNDPGAVTRELKARGYKSGDMVSTLNYGIAGTLALELGQWVSIMGDGSRWGRHDDWVTRWSDYDGKDVWIFTLGNRSQYEGAFGGLFNSIQLYDFKIDGHDALLMHGRGYRWSRARLERERILGMYYGTCRP